MSEQTHLPSVLRDKARNKKLVILYPWSSSKSQLLGSFLHQDDEAFLYYRVTASQTSLRQFAEGLMTEFNDVLGGFGRQLRSVLTGEVKAADIGAALASDLNDYADRDGRNIVVYLDELDRLPMDKDFESFAQTFVDALNGHVQLAISSRLLKQDPWSRFINSGKAVVIGAESRNNDVMFSIEEEPKPQLEVYAFGRGHALVNGKPITNWDGALPRNLFYFFIDRPLVTRQDIFETFWPDLTVKEATNVFHVTKRKIAEKISSQINDGHNYELTQYMTGFYLPSEKLVRHYDVLDFTEAVSLAQATDDEREQFAHYSRAVDLYRAPFLQTIEMKWIKEKRDNLRQQYAQALIGLGRIWQGRQNYHEALGYFVRAAKETPEREDLHRDIISLYKILGMNDDALQHFRRMEGYFKDTLGTSPSKETKALVAKLR